MRRREEGKGSDLAWWTWLADMGGRHEANGCNGKGMWQREREEEGRGCLQRIERLAVAPDGQLVIELATCGGVGGRQAGGRDCWWLGR